MAFQSLVGFEVVEDAIVMLTSAWSDHVMGSIVEWEILRSIYLSTKKLSILEYELCGAEK